MFFVYEYTKLSDRLRVLYDLKRVDLNSRGWASAVASEMFKTGIATYSAPEPTKDEIAKAHSSVAHRLKEHLNTDSVENLSGLWLTRYCKYFGCSAAYLFGEISLPTIPQTDICPITGLSPASVSALISLQKDDNDRPASAINQIFRKTEGALLQYISQYIEGDAYTTESSLIFDSDGNVSLIDLYRETILHKITAELDALKKAP